MPGQHLTLQLTTSSGSPTTRCYSLSNSFRPDTYRISVKQALPPVDNPHVSPGVASTFINDELGTGDHVLAKTPSGSFYLSPGLEPIVLLGAGVGITPLMSMIETIVAQGANRSVLLFYGNSSGQTAIFYQRLNEISERCPNISVINCLTRPTEQDQLGINYHFNGRVSIELLQQVLPSNQFQYFMCGPAAFIESLYSGLIDWGVSDSQIHFEAFGPSTVKRVSETQQSSGVTAPTRHFQIRLTESDQELEWNGEHDSLLELTEQNEIWIDSGCRAGSCGTCQTTLLKGKVSYPGHEGISCDPGKCLPCVALPESDLELEV